MTTRPKTRARRQVAQTSVSVDPVGVRLLLPSTEPDRPPSSRDLLLQGLLHLPRLASSDGMVDAETGCAELRRLQALRADELEPFTTLAAAPAFPPTIDELDVRVIAGDDAEPIESHFHYLRSFRADSVHVAAVYGPRIVALCSVSPFDLFHVTEDLPIAPADVAVVSRVFAFDWAPRNTISFMLARTERFCSARLLLTYLNPNMGFTGASYKSANWELVGFETGTRYAYLDGRYITDRQLAVLPEAELSRVEFSRMRLMPLEFYGRFLDRKTSRNRAPRPPFMVARPPLPARA
jgi:hypothetical protein